MVVGKFIVNGVYIICGVVCFEVIVVGNFGNGFDRFVMVRCDMLFGIFYFVDGLI